MDIRINRALTKLQGVAAYLFTILSLCLVNLFMPSAPKIKIAQTPDFRTEKDILAELTKKIGQHQHASFEFIVDMLAILLITVIAIGTILDVAYLKKIRTEKKPALAGLLPGISGKEFLRITSITMLFYTILKLTVNFLAASPGQMVGVTLLINLFFQGAILCTLIRYTTINTLRLRAREILKKPFLVFKAYLMCIPFLFLALLATNLLTKILKIPFSPQAAVQFLSEVRHNPFFTAVMVTQIVLIGPFLEELLFRGILYRFLRSRFSLSFSIFVSAVAFGLLHTHLFSFLPIVVLGGALAYLYEKTENLIFPVAFHALHNLVNLGILMLLERFMKAFVL